MILFSCLYQLSDKLFGFPASGSISYGNECYVILINPFVDQLFAFFDLVLRRSGVDGCSVQVFPDRVHHSHFTAGAIRRIDTYNHLIFEWRLEQQALQVGGKGFDGVLVGLFG